MRWLLLAAAVLCIVPQSSTEYVLVKPGSKEYHRPGCDVVRDPKSVVAMTRGEAESRGLKPHAACDPARSPSTKNGTFAVQYVFVESGDKRYHRETCPKLGKARQRITLDAAAGKKYWPCPVCKPPIRKRAA
jgi:hypothetical protein